MAETCLRNVCHGEQPNKPAPCFGVKAGLTALCPVPMQVADYILSPGMCVERKAVPDLRQSLNSGRLFSQAEAMVRHYDLPVLLIEFEEDKAFRLFSENEVTDRISVSRAIALSTI